MLVVQSYYPYQNKVEYFCYNYESIARLKIDYQVGMWKIKKLK